MSSSSWCGWQILPENVFSDIMLMMGLGSLDGLQQCRQVCQSWNVMMSQMTKHHKEVIRRKVDVLADEVRVDCLWETYHDRGGVLFNSQDILCASSLAHHGLLGSLEYLGLWQVDLASVPPHRLASLASCVTNCIDILPSASNIDLVSFLDSINCEELKLTRDYRLEKREEVQALMRAMETRLVFVYLRPEDMMTVLTQYSGRGRCSKLVCDLPDYQASLCCKLVNEVKSWARRINWRVSLRGSTLKMIGPYHWNFDTYYT